MALRRHGCLIGIAVGVLGLLMGLAPRAGAFTFRSAPGSPYAVSYGDPLSATVGDFDGDGLPDFALGTWAHSPSNTVGTGGVSVFLADGAGGFRLAGRPIGLGGGSPVSVAAADFNADGKSDLAAANDGAVSVFLSKGDGTFGPAPGSPIQAPQAFEIVAGEFNGDGKPDLAVLNRDDTVSVLLGNGQGTFTAAPGSPIALGGGSPGSMAVGDFNGDGRADLAVTDDAHGTVTVLLGNGDGTFAPATGPPFAVGSMPGTVVVGDFNGDGRQDLAIATSAGVSVLLGRGDGTFTSAPGSPVLLPDRFPGGMVAGDFNGDGRRDLAVGNENFGSGLDLLLGDGTGEFRFAPGSPFSVGSPRVLAGGEFDGRAGLIVSPPGTLAATVSVLLAPLPSDPPQATLVVDPNPVLTGAPVKLDASASSDPLDRAIVDYRWDIGSGMLDRDTGRNPTISKTYAAAGTVNLRLRVTNADGETAIATAKLTVLAPTTARIRKLLDEQLSPPAQAARISSLLRHRGYSFAFPAPTAGRLQIRWYLPNHATRKPVLIAAGRRMFAPAGIAKVSVSLTRDGKRLLLHRGSLLVTARGTFTRRGKRPVFAMRTLRLVR